MRSKKIWRQEGRDLQRFDVDFDLPDRFTPEFPPPIFPTTHPELGDISRRPFYNQNCYALVVGILTPVQIEGLRLLLTSFPQEESIRPRIVRAPIRARGLRAGALGE